MKTIKVPPFLLLALVGFINFFPHIAEASEKQILVNGVELNYIDEGNGIPVVFVHAAFSDLRG